MSVAQATWERRRRRQPGSQAILAPNISKIFEHACEGVAAKKSFRSTGRTREPHVTLATECPPPTLIGTDQRRARFFQNSRQLRAVSMFSTTSLLDLRRKFGHHSGCAFDGAPATKHPRRLTIILQRCASARLATLSSPAYRTRRNLRLVSDVIAYQPSSLQPIQTLPAKLWHHQGHIEGRSLQQRARRE